MLFGMCDVSPAPAAGALTCTSSGVATLVRVRDVSACSAPQLSLQGAVLWQIACWVPIQAPRDACASFTLFLAA